jgi:gamma-glutamyl-gamma-aminobutyrate hydrolase PuuD
MFLLIQWHPERMVDQSNPFSYNVRQEFLKYIIETTKKNNLITEGNIPENE